MQHYVTTDELIGFMLKKYRISSKETQAEVADTMDITHTVYSRIESGKVPISISRLRHYLSNEYQMELSSFLCLVEEYDNTLLSKGVWVMENISEESDMLNVSKLLDKFIE